MKVRELVNGWPLSGWSAGWLLSLDPLVLEAEAGTLQLSEFTGPDAEGWFFITARDPEGHEWSNGFLVGQPEMRSALQQALADNLRSSLIDIGEINIASSATNTDC